MPGRGARSTSSTSTDQPAPSTSTSDAVAALLPDVVRSQRATLDQEPDASAADCQHVGPAPSLNQAGATPAPSLNQVGTVPDQSDDTVNRPSDDTVNRPQATPPPPTLSPSVGAASATSTSASHLADARVSQLLTPIRSSHVSSTSQLNSRPPPLRRMNAMPAGVRTLADALRMPAPDASYRGARRTGPTARPAPYLARAAIDAASVNCTTTAAQRSLPPARGPRAQQDPALITAWNSAHALEQAGQLLLRTRDMFLNPLERAQSLDPRDDDLFHNIQVTSAELNIQLASLSNLCLVLAEDLGSCPPERSIILPSLQVGNGLLETVATDIDLFATNLLLIYQAANHVRETLGKELLAYAIGTSSRLLAYSNAIRCSYDRTLLGRILRALE